MSIQSLENNLNKEFVTNEQAKELQILGFNEICLGYYRHYTDGKKELRFDNSKMRNIEAPTYSQAFRFFRDNYKLHSTIAFTSSSLFASSGYMIMIDIIEPHKALYDLDNDYKTYEEAEQACLNKLIEIVKNDKSK